MKKKNFYKKMGLVFAIALGTSIATSAQNDSAFYKIDNVHNGDGGMGSISVLNLIVQNGSKLSLNVFQKPDSIIWMHYDAENPQTQYNSNDSIIVIKNSEVVRAYVLLDKQWYTQKDIYKSVTTDTTSQNPIDSSLIKNDTGTFYNPYEALDIIVKDGLNYSISNSYTADSVRWYYYGLHDSTYFTSTELSLTIVKDAIIRAYVLSNSKWYTQKNTFYGINYDSTGSGQLSVPVISNATYTWYLNDTLLQDVTTYSYIPTDTGTYKVVVEWIAGSNLRTESATNSATFEFKVKSLPVVTSVESQTSETSIGYVYPNPTSEHVYINEKSIFEYRIENTNATIVATGIGNTLTQVNLNGLNSGVYFVYINTGNKQTVKKLIIK